MPYVISCFHFGQKNNKNKTKQKAPRETGTNNPKDP